jgi:hypothetical protein
MNSYYCDDLIDFMFTLILDVFTKQFLYKLAEKLGRLVVYNDFWWPEICTRGRGVPPYRSLSVHIILILDWCAVVARRYLVVLDQDGLFRLTQNLLVWILFFYTICFYIDAAL